MLGYNSSDSQEKDTNTFLTGANVVETKKEEINVDSLENSQALVEQNMMNNPNYKRLGNKSLQEPRMKSNKSEAQIHRRSTTGLSSK